MLNSLISAKVTAWFQREDCPVRQIIEHILKAGFLRDAQIEAITTYLFLKIEGGNRPLGELFAEGFSSPQEDLELIEWVNLDCTSAEGAWRSDTEIKIDKKGFVTRNGQKTKMFWDATITSDRKPLRLKIRNIAGDESVLCLDSSGC